MRQLLYQLRYSLPIWFVGLLTDWWPDNRVTIRIRGALYSPFLGRCGRRFTVARRVTFLNVHGIEVGDDVYIATGAWIDGIGGVKIGSEVKFSPYVVVASSAHCFKDGSVARGGARTAPVVIGRGTWLSSHVVVAAGAVIGEGCLIGGNAVVSGQIPDHVFAGGVPARVLREVSDAPGTVFSRFDAAAASQHQPVESGRS